MEHLVQSFHTLRGQATSSKDQGPVPWLIQFASSRHLAPAAATSASLRLATDSHDMEEIQSETQCADSATAETVALHAVKSMSHAEHFALLAPLRFDNDSHWCCANAALAAWMWSTLSHNDFFFARRPLVNVTWSCSFIIQR